MKASTLFFFHPRRAVLAVAFVGLFSSALSVSAQTFGHPPAAPAGDAPLAAGAFSVRPGQARGAWLERLTLGAGDVVNLALFGSPELTQTEIPIGPDGRISFLEAQDIMASGLTIDELRQKLDESLGKYRRAARTLVSPVTFQSKKYFVLGKVSSRGVFTLDRPMTVIEAVAKARGLESGLAQGRLADLADLSRSFLVRQGERVPINLEKLFVEGDLSQNTAIEPGDYLFFSPTQLAELYVLGEVRLPGVADFRPATGAVAAITQRGGFTDRAWQKKVLIVRGSINKPQTFIVDVADVLAGRIADFPLQPRDIVFVNARPWIRAEELLDIAASAFVQAAVIVWTGEKVYSTIR